MGIKTYSIGETKEILKEAGYEVIKNSGKDVIYIPSKLMLHKESGVFYIDVEVDGRLKSIYSGFSEDEACRNVLQHFNLKTVRNKKKTQQNAVETQ